MKPYCRFPRKRQCVNISVLLPTLIQKMTQWSHSLCVIAEREGFKPPVPFSTPVFKTGAIDHSAISP